MCYCTSENLEIPGSLASRAPRDDALSQLGLRHDFRPRRLMHRRVRGVSDPWLLVDHRKPPVAATGAGEMIEPGYRTIVDVERQSRFDQAAEREADGRPDGSTMRNGDDIPACLLESDALDRTLHPV